MKNLYNYSIQPNNYIAEEILVGYIIINPFLLKTTLKNISVEHFFIESHKILYKSLKLINDSTTIHQYNIFLSLQYQQIFKEENILSNLIKLIKQVYIFNSSNNIDFYVIQLIQIINETYNKRIIIKYAYNIINLTYRNEVPVKEILQRISKYLNYITLQTNTESIDNSQAFIINLVKAISANNTRLIPFKHTIYSGFESLDTIIRGLPDGDLIIIAGRPSMGKTSLAINIVYYILKKTNIQICIFSLEMTKLQILQKIIAIGSHIPLYYIFEGKINEYQWQKVIKICNTIIKSNIYINDTCHIAIEDIYEISQTIYQEVNISMLIIIDYLQLIHIQNLEFESRSQELSYITRQLKILAQNLNIPIIILSQLNRRIETRHNKKPLLSDLKESGCISYTLLFSTIPSTKISISNANQYIQYIWPYTKYKIEQYKSYKYNYISMRKLVFFIEQTFHNINYSIKFLEMTSNHPLLIHKRWLVNNMMQQYNCISSSFIISPYIKGIQKYVNILTTCSINNLVYDLSHNEYINFFYLSVILHNSIEQDADIIIMLYSDENNNKELQGKNLIKEKIIDINISKNRNGSTGSLKLLFNPENTSFTEFNNLDSIIN
uniref:Replicative DNA helicase subunit n=1 Tax=Eucheuma denticulatum TaxID=305493 RepID=A0A8E7PGH0_9FLOR|nr:replicative DNA helicase subunit [Eucheuma denticulatum]